MPSISSRPSARYDARAVRAHDRQRRRARSSSAHRAARYAAGRARNQSSLRRRHSRRQRHRAQAETIHQPPVVIGRRIGRGQELRPVEDRIGAGDEAQSLHLVRHVLAPGREPHHRARHGDARGRDRAHELDRIELLPFASGVPSTCTSMLIGTLSGCAGRLASVAIMPTRSSSPSPMPTMPPQQTWMPASRTWSSVSSRS